MKLTSHLRLISRSRIYGVTSHSPIRLPAVVLEGQFFTSFTSEKRVIFLIFGYNQLCCYFLRLQKIKITQPLRTFWFSDISCQSQCECYLMALPCHDNMESPWPAVLNSRFRMNTNLMFWFITVVIQIWSFYCGLHFEDWIPKNGKKRGQKENIYVYPH